MVSSGPKARWRLIWPETPLGRAFWGISTILLVLIAAVDPFGIDTRAETSAAALVHAVSVRYDSRANNNVVLIETTIQGTRDGLYGEFGFLSLPAQAQLVDMLVEARARVIFFDAEYLRPLEGEYPVSGVSQLVEAIDRANGQNIEVFVGGISTAPGWRPLAESARQTRLSWSADHPGDYGLVNADGVRTAAADLYLVMCEGVPGGDCNADLVHALKTGRAAPIALNFAASYPVLQSDFSGPAEGERCRRPMIAGLRDGLLGRAQNEPCPQNLTIPAEIMLELGGRREIQQLLAGKAVLIGAGPGLGDDHVVLGVGTVPGVSLHATALSNLLAFGTGYAQWPADFVSWMRIGPDELLKLAAVIMMPLLATGFAAHQNERPHRSKRARRRLALETIAAFVAMGGVFVAMASVGIWLGHWPLSVAVMTGALGAAATHFLSGAAFRKAVHPLTDQAAAWVLIAVTLVGLMAIFWPVASAVIAFLILVATFWFWRLGWPSLSNRETRNGEP